MLAEYLPQRFVQKMGRGMMAPGRRAPRVIVREFDRIPALERPAFDDPDMDEQIAKLLLRVRVPRNTAPLAPRMTPSSPTWPPLSPRRRLVQDQRAFLVRT